MMLEKTYLHIHFFDHLNLFVYVLVGIHVSTCISRQGLNLNTINLKFSPTGEIYT